MAGIAESEGMDESKKMDLILCVGESTTNAIKHADGGIATVYKEKEGILFIVEDHGKGIPEIALPEVAMKRGYSTAVSLGMGYKAMIAVADKVYLATDRKGTTVAIQMGLHPMPMQSLSGLMDMWSLSR